VNDLEAQLRAAGVIGVLRAPNAGAAIQAALAADRAGLRVLELTFTTPGCLEALPPLLAQVSSGTLIGMGTVLNAQQARDAIAAGAQFLVSPHVGEDILEVALETDTPYLPGVLTPTEIVSALRLGARILKLFPAASSGGAAYLRDLRGPFPTVQLVPTGGVQPHEVGVYRAAGALAVGLGSHLFSLEAMERGDWSAMERSARTHLQQASP
jgi:2-dehydro-3-deoxyphosphogluconate aldolase/(4S)-4-hydroxy-2-oxoglutarate aldolase